MLYLGIRRWLRTDAIADMGLIGGRQKLYLVIGFGAGGRSI